MHSINTLIDDLVRPTTEVARTIGGNRAPDNNFTVSGSKSIGVEVDVAELMDICLAENERRLGGYDPRLLRPTTMPQLVRLARRSFLKPRHKKA